MTRQKNAVERRIDVLCEQWLRATEAPDVRAVIWRVPDNADRMMAAFFEAQAHPELAGTPDFFLRLSTPFETGFGYSRALKEDLRRRYLDSRDNMAEEGVAQDWLDAYRQQPDTAAGTLAQWASFATHHRERMRYFAAVLSPEQVASPAAFERWLDAALATPAPANVRLVLVDYASTRQWQPLVERHGSSVTVIDAPVDMFDIARDIAAQSGGAGPQTAFRQMLADVMTLLDKGSASQVVARGERAIALAQRADWPDQQVVVHMAVAGAYMKEQQFPEAIARYRTARERALDAERASHPAGLQLVMQTWFGEAGVWLVAGQPERAAAAYAEGAEVARRMPNAMFVIEGLRMAGFCLAQAGRREPARDYGLQALAAARDVPASDRPMTTLPLLLQDLLRLQDAPRTEKIERAAEQYRVAVESARDAAEMRAARLGADPTCLELERIEAELQGRYETAFANAARERERQIAGGDAFFRRVVAVGRDFLHPRWSGLPDIRHPLDKAIVEWSEPPQFAVLPDPEPLFTPESATVARAPAAEETVA
ncbi:hypothetical protein [Cognatilysobacter bugurensis]|nr:hypothetical protein [Lysobacter bugurensis]